MPAFCRPLASRRWRYGDRKNVIASGLVGDLKRPVRRKFL
jgi:hypothetical protein